MTENDAIALEISRILLYAHAPISHRTKATYIMMHQLRDVIGNETTADRINNSRSKFSIRLQVDKKKKDKINQQKERCLRIWNDMELLPFCLVPLTY